MAKMQLTTVPRAQVSLPAEFTISAKTKQNKKNPSFSSYPRTQVTFVPSLSLTQARISRVAPESSSFLTWTFLRPSWPTSIWLHCLTPPTLPAEDPSRCKPDAPPWLQIFQRIFLAFPLSLCCSAPPSSHPPSSIHKHLEFLSHAVSGLCDSAPS